MKNKKLLITLASISALPIASVSMSVTSCNKNTETLTLSATYSGGTKTYYGVKIAKEDFTVKTIAKDGTETVIGAFKWEWDKEGNSYTVSESDLGKTLVFQIKYENLTTKVSLKVSDVVSCDFALPFINLCSGTNTDGKTFGTSLAIYMYAQDGEGNYQLLDLNKFDITDTARSENASNVSVVKHDDVYYLQAAEGLDTTTLIKGSLEARVKGETSSDPVATLPYNISNNQEALIVNGNITTIKLKKAEDDTPTSFKGLTTIPSHVSIAGKWSAVSNITSNNATDLETINTVLIPSSITRIKSEAFTVQHGRLFNIYYEGTAEQWAEVEQGELWAGPFATFVNCLLDGKVVDLATCAHSQYNPSSKLGKPCVEVTKPIGTDDIELYTVSLDYSLQPTATAEIYNCIYWTNDSTAATEDFQIQGVYADGVALEYGEDKHFTLEFGARGKSCTLTFTTAGLGQMTNASMMTVKFFTPNNSKDKVWVGAYTK